MEGNYYRPVLSLIKVDINFISMVLIKLQFIVILKVTLLAILMVNLIEKASLIDKVNLPDNFLDCWVADSFASLY